MVEAERPPASSPSKAASASSKSPVGYALQVEDRDQHLEALRSARIGRQNCRREADPRLALADTVANPGRAHPDRTDAAHDLALGQMPMANQPLLAFLCQKARMPAEEIENLGLDGLRQKLPRTTAQNFSQRILECAWLGELNDIILGHGVSSFNGEWRHEHPHDTPPHLITPSPTFAHISGGALRLDFYRRLMLQFCGSVVTSDAGLLPYRELDDVLGLTVIAGNSLADARTGKNGRYALVGLLRQSVFSRLAGYEDVNDAERLRHDPAMRWIVGGKATSGCAASPSQMGRFETQWLTVETNLSTLTDLSGQWIDRVHGRRPLRGVVLDMDSSVSPTHGEQEMSLWNGHYECTC
jgi:hypothetical protein